MAITTYRRPGVYIKKSDISYDRDFIREQIKERLKTDPELLSEIIYELRQEKLKKINEKMK